MSWGGGTLFLNTHTAWYRKSNPVNRSVEYEIQIIRGAIVLLLATGWSEEALKVAIATNGIKSYVLHGSAAVARIKGDCPPKMADCIWQIIDSREVAREIVRNQSIVRKTRGDSEQGMECVIPAI